MSSHPPVIKDESSEHPIPAIWRDMLSLVVARFSIGDFELSEGVEGVDQVTRDVASQNRAYVGEYGEILVELPQQTWDTSCVQWMGSHWEVLVDLSTVGEGLSDMVLTGQMTDVDGEYKFKVGLIYVP